MDADLAGAMWDRFVAYHARRIGIEPDKLVNLIGGAAGLRQDFLDAQSDGVTVMGHDTKPPAHADGGR